MPQTDPPESPLDALWRADEPPARDHAFTLAALGRMGTANLQTTVLRRLLIGLGAGGAVAGGMLIMQTSGPDAWSMAVIAAAVSGALWIGGRLVAAG